MRTKQIAILLGIIIALPAVAQGQSTDNGYLGYIDCITLADNEPEISTDKRMDQCPTISDVICNIKDADLWTILTLPKSNTQSSFAIASKRTVSSPNYQLENITKTMRTYAFSGIAAVVFTFMAFGFVGFDTSRV